MRLFVACEIGDAAREAAAGLIDGLRRRAAGAAPDARITWVAPERLHLTVRFIGETHAEQGARVLEALRDPIEVAPFTIEWGALGAFPPKGSPRVLWAGVERGADDLARVEQAVSRRLITLGIAPEDRPYRPHLTLARVRDAAGLRAGPLLEGLAATLGRSPVRAITLFESRLSPKGPTYTALHQTRLQA